MGWIDTYTVEVNLLFQISRRSLDGSFFYNIFLFSVSYSSSGQTTEILKGLSTINSKVRDE